MEREKDGLKLLSRIPAAGALLLAGGCAASLSEGRPAKVLEPGQWEVGFGVGVLAPVGVIQRAIDNSIDEAKEIAKKQASGEEIEVDLRPAVTAAVGAVAIMTTPPAPMHQLDVRYGLVKRLDVGFRYSGATLRAEAHGQIFDGGTWKVLGGLGLGRQTFESLVLDILDMLELANFKRTDVDASVLVGREWEYGAVWFGAKAMYSKYSAEGLLAHDNRVVVTDASGKHVFSLELGHSLLAGGIAGGRVGWKYVWLVGELGVHGSRYRPEIMGEEHDLGGLVVFPMVGAAVTW